MEAIEQYNKYKIFPKEYRTVKPGWEKIELKPLPECVEYVSGRILTPKGMLDVSWRRCEGTFKIKIRFLKV